ncbi:RDD family protein [Methylocella tundrae]|uniref:RDD domain containing protein n=1 Tax=Methylocella tundrae TaxID=227605 RepID=A0A4U8Z0X6_METTU|nr:RDD family protein [Methylocella tundrae]WPP06255.1 RDD family protein [Methylocella tundrae]VFU08930.1 RDD domain containing protein [Methylocella tundrae]
MSDLRGFDRWTMPGAAYLPANLPPAAFSGVLFRRIMAFILDFILVSIFSVAIWFALAFLTLGLTVLILPPIFPFVAFFYNGLTVSGAQMATPGMRAMDLELRLIDGQRVPFLIAAAHAVLFYLSTMFPPIFLVALVTDGKRCLHDILAGVIITRRPF